MLEDHLHIDTGRRSGGPVPEDGLADPDGMDFLPDLLAALRADGLSDRELVDQLRTLEKISSATAAAKIVLTAELHQQRCSTDAQAGIDTRHRGRGVAHEVALARKESPHLARQHLAVAKVLPHQMPSALEALRRGDLNEAQVMILVRECADLTDADRACADATLATRYGALGTKELTLAAQRIVFTLDPTHAEERARRARSRRAVTCRSIGDGMARITGQITAQDAITTMQSLREYADARRAMGDDRSRDQLVADAFVDRLNRSFLETTNATAASNGTGDDEESPRPTRGVEIQLVMNAEMLLGADTSTPAHLPGYGPIPMGIGADLLADEDLQVLIRRLYANPEDNSLVAMDSKGIVFRHGLRRLLFARDGDICRTPGCNAPPRHGDHVTPRARGGSTTLHGGQGLCEDCNYAKESPGWRHVTTSTWPERHQVRITTPTGHAYESNAPPLPVGASTTTPPPHQNDLIDWTTLSYPPLIDQGMDWAA